MIFEFRSATCDSPSLLETVVVVTSFIFEGLAIVLSIFGDWRIKLLDAKSAVEIITCLNVLLEAVFTDLHGDNVWTSNFPADLGELLFELSFTGVVFLWVDDGETDLAGVEFVVKMGEALVSFTTDADFALEAQGVRVRTFLLMFLSNTSLVLLLDGDSRTWSWRIWKKKRE